MGQAAGWIDFTRDSMQGRLVDHSLQHASCASPSATCSMCWPHLELQVARGLELVPQMLNRLRKGQSGVYTACCALPDQPQTVGSKAGLDQTMLEPVHSVNPV